MPSHPPYALISLTSLKQTRLNKFVFGSLNYIRIRDCLLCFFNLLKIFEIEVPFTEKPYRFHLICFPLGFVSHFFMTSSFSSLYHRLYCLVFKVQCFLLNACALKNDQCVLLYRHISKSDQIIITSLISECLPFEIFSHYLSSP